VKKKLFLSLLFIGMLVGWTFASSFAEEKKPLSVEDIENLLKSNVSKKRILMTLEENGVKFPKTRKNTESLKTIGADEVVLAAIEKEWKKDGRVLVVETIPMGATVYLDGESVGEAPVEMEGLKPRTYSIRVMKEGYEQVEHGISLTEGIGRKLTISLVKSSRQTTPPPAPPAVPRPGAVAAPPPPSSAPTPAPTQTPPQMCSIFINTHPAGAKIYVNGKHFGMSPKYIELPPGEHSMVLLKEYYKPEEKKISIREGETVLPPIDQTLVPMR